MSISLSPTPIGDSQMVPGLARFSCFRPAPARRTTASPPPSIAIVISSCCGAIAGTVPASCRRNSAAMSDQPRPREESSRVDWRYLRSPWGRMSLVIAGPPRQTAAYDRAQTPPGIDEPAASAFRKPTVTWPPMLGIKAHPRCGSAGRAAFSQSRDARRWLSPRQRRPWKLLPAL